MNATDYQQQAKHSYIDTPNFPISDHDLMVVRYALGLAGEAGEVANYVKKSIFRPDGEITLDLAKLEDEIGDVLWYVAALCSITGLDLGGVMEWNIEKIKARYPEGWGKKPKTRPVSITETIARINDRMAKLWSRGADLYAAGQDSEQIQRKIARYSRALMRVEQKLPSKRRG